MYLPTVHQDLCSEGGCSDHDDKGAGCCRRPGSIIKREIEAEGKADPPGDPGLPGAAARVIQLGINARRHSTVCKYSYSPPVPENLWRSMMILWTFSRWLFWLLCPSLPLLYICHGCRRLQDYGLCLVSSETSRSYENNLCPGSAVFPAGPTHQGQRRAWSRRKGEYAYEDDQSRRYSLLGYMCQLPLYPPLLGYIV